MPRALEEGYTLLGGGSDPSRADHHLDSRGLRELDAFVAPGSHITVAIDPALVDRRSLDEELLDLRDSMANALLDVRDERDAGYPELVEIVADGDADHALVLCYQAGLSTAEADARALVTTLQVQRAMTERGRDTTIVTELLDQRDVALAPRRSAGDFIVSDRLISLVLTQVAENPTLVDVFEDLLSPDGSELYCKPAARYTDPERPTTFGALVAVAADRGESAIGYRLREAADDQARAFGIVLNPPKLTPVTLGPDDQLIVMAERG
jgi:hypothetical protein